MISSGLFRVEVEVKGLTKRYSEMIIRPVSENRAQGNCAGPLRTDYAPHRQQCLDNVFYLTSRRKKSGHATANSFCGAINPTKGTAAQLLDSIIRLVIRSIPTPFRREP
jgi:hypothetical protein